jgi:putative spermidine/putrescine transport system permease protein
VNGTWALRAITYVVIVLLLLPVVVIIVTSFTTANYVSFPPTGFTLRWYGEALAKKDYLNSFYLSAGIAIIAALVSALVGTLVAIGLVRYRFAGREAINAFFLSPLIVPTVVIGIALLQFYNRVGFGSTFLGLVAGHVIITTPYVIRLVSASLTGITPNLERAARNLGAAPIRAFLRVTAPRIAPGIIAGAMFAFITSFDNVTVSVFLSSPRAVTLPVRIYAQTDQPVFPWLIAICSLIILFSACLIMITERLVGVQRIFLAK